MSDRIKLSRRQRRTMVRNLWRMLHADADAPPASALQTMIQVMPPALAAAAAAVLLVKYGKGYRPSADGWNVAERAADAAGVVLVSRPIAARPSRRRRAGVLIPRGFRFGIDADSDAEREGAAADALRDWTDGRAVVVNPAASRFARFGRQYDQRRAERRGAAERASARRWSNNRAASRRAMLRITAAFAGSACGQALSKYGAYLGKTAAEKDKNATKHAERVLERFLAHASAVNPDVTAALAALLASAGIGSAAPAA